MVNNKIIYNNGVDNNNLGELVSMVILNSFNINKCNNNKCSSNNNNNMQCSNNNMHMPCNNNRWLQVDMWTPIQECLWQRNKIHNNHRCRDNKILINNKCNNMVNNQHMHKLGV